MNIKQILFDSGVEDEKIESIAKNITKEIHTDFIPKDQYNKKVLELDETKKEMSSLQGKASEVDAFKAKYEAEQAAHEETKNAYTAEKTISVKRSALHKQLASDGCNPKLLKLLEKEFDLAKLEIDGEGDAAKIKSWDTLSKSVKEQYSDVFGKVETTGANVADPPVGKDTKPATNKDMNSFIRGTL